MSFVDELKRRNVFRVAIAYLVAAWLVLQVVDVVSPLLELPQSLGRTVLILLAIGFPVAVVLAWVYELTPDGVKLESEVDRSLSIVKTTGRKLDFAIIGVLTVAVIMFSLDRFVWDSGEAVEGSAGQAIAVLPFVNLSADPEQEFFADGLAEEMLNLLVRVPELNVTSRATAFSYKGKDYRIPDVGRDLGVDHVLEGSVRRSGDQIRISARLVETATDLQIWSDVWERNLDDVFAIQDEIALAVVDGMRVSLMGDVPKTVRTNPHAYELYLQAGQLLNHRIASNTLESEGLLIQALEIDSQYAPAWLRLSNAYLIGGAVGAWNPEQSFPLARSAAAEVQRIDPDNVDALMVLARVAMAYDYDMNAAEAYVAIANSGDPEDSVVSSAEIGLMFLRGDYDSAIPRQEMVRDNDPGDTNQFYFLGQMYLLDRQYEKSKEAFRRAIELSPSSAGSHLYLGVLLIIESDFELARKEIEQETRDGYRQTGIALLNHAQGKRELADQALKSLTEIGYRWTYQIAAVHAFRNEPDEAFTWLERAISRRDTSLHLIVGDPLMDNIRDDPRFNVILERLGRTPRDNSGI